MSPSFFSQLLSRTREIGDHTARKIETALGIKRGVLDGFMPDADHSAASPPAVADDDEFVEIPVIGPSEDLGPDVDVEIPFYTSVAASVGHGAANDGSGGRPPIKLRFRKTSVNRQNIDPARSMVIYVRGNSMEPLMYSGDQIMIDTSRTTIRDGELYVIRVDDDEMVKRLYRRPGDRVLVQSENPAFPPYEVSLNEPGFTVLGQVVWRAGWTT